MSACQRPIVDVNVHAVPATRAWAVEGGLVESLLAAKPGPRLTRAVFLDRDGTLIHDPGYLADPGLVRLLPGVPAALLGLQKAGFLLVIVSNQSGVRRGLLTNAALREVHRRVVALLEDAGVELAGAWYCTHGPDDGCACRKPAPGMLLRAGDRLGLELSACWMVGDKPSDAEAGRAAGARALMLDTATPDLVAAAARILSAENEARD